MEKLKFSKTVDAKLNIVYSIEPAIKKVIKGYSVDGKIRAYYFDDRKNNKLIANSLFYNGNDLLNVQYFSDNSKLKVCIELFGNDKERLEKVKDDLNSGLEKLLF